MIKIVDNRTADARIFDDLDSGDFFEHHDKLYIKIDDDSALVLNDGVSSTPFRSGTPFHFLPSAEVTKLKVTITIEGAE